MVPYVPLMHSVEAHNGVLSGRTTMAACALERLVLQCCPVCLMVCFAGNFLHQVNHPMRRMGSTGTNRGIAVILILARRFLRQWGQLGQCYRVG